MEELWEAVKDKEGYEVSTTGKVRSYWIRVGLGPGKGSKTIKSDISHLLEQNRDSRGYWQVKLRTGSQCVHTLMLRAFKGEPKEGEVGRHLDDNKDHNVLWNLEWGTKQQNSQDRVLNRKANAKLFPEDVRRIREKLAMGEKRSLIAKEFKIDLSVISRINSGERWSYV